MGLGGLLPCWWEGMAGASLGDEPFPLPRSSALTFLVLCSNGGADSGAAPLLGAPGP